MMEKLLGLPVLASEHGRQVDDLIIYVHWLMIVLFVGWIAYFAYVLFRFHHSRNPKADYFGVRSHISSWIEGIVALVEGILLVAIAVPFWARAVDKFPKESESTVIQVVAQQFAWNIRYPGKDGIFGKQDMHWVTPDNVFGVDPNDPHGKDDIQTLNEMHVPLVKNPDGTTRPVIIYISSKDVVHSFKVIALRVTQDAIPGMRIPIWFRPTEEGRFQINCAQLCGNGHSSMSQGFLTVESEAAYEKWLASKAGSATSFE
ncbi:MAG TPA: cytochrome c oxidase subunit II [Verrucomicrobiae bacterium]|nr:cytochrome c oxidase subunit II [Verrucomicrobiae bacterium]